MPTSRNAPRRLRKRGGTGSHAARSSAGMTARAIGARSDSTSHPMMPELRADHRSTIGSPIHIAAVMAHDDRSTTTMVDGTNLTHGRTNKSSEDGRPTVVVTADQSSSLDLFERPWVRLVPST